MPLFLIIGLYGFSTWNLQPKGGFLVAGCCMLAKGKVPTTRNYTLHCQRKGDWFVPILQIEIWKREMLRYLSTFRLPVMEPRSLEFDSSALTTKPSSLQFQCLINDDDVCSFLLSSHPFINDNIVVVPLLCVWLPSSYTTSSWNHVLKGRIHWSYQVLS